MPPIQLAPSPENEILLAANFSQNFITIPSHCNVKEALAKVRQGAQRGDIFYVYVNNGAGRLSGVVSIRNLLVSKEGELVSEISEGGVVSLREGTPLSEVYRIFFESRFLSLPITDHTGILRGVVYAHELIGDYRKELNELFEERSRGELFELLGIQAEHASTSSLKAASHRLPWLLINVFGGLLSAFFIHSLSQGLPNAVEFLAFVPILLIVSESMGIQTASVFVANAHRVGDQVNKVKLLLRECSISLVLGICTGMVVALAALVWKKDWDLSLAIVITLALASLIASILGCVIPVLLHRLKRDPRIASGPLILAIADSSILVLYLVVAVRIATY